MTGVIANAGPPGSRAPIPGGNQREPQADRTLIKSDRPLGLGRIPPPDLRRLIESAPDGIAVLNATSRQYVYVNPAGCALLGQPLEKLVATVAQFALEPVNSLHRVDRLHVDGEFEYSTTHLSGSGRSLFVVHFRDVTRQRQHERLLEAFSRTSASIAFAGTLAGVLDRMAEETRQATGMASCTFLLMNDDAQLRLAGVTAQSYPGVTDYGQRLERCRALGAPLLSLDAFHHRRPVVARSWRQRTLQDPRFEPLHDISAIATWDTLVTVPLIGRGKILGVMNGYYPADSALEDEELNFLTAIANQAAVAVENAALLGAVERKAALEERHLLVRELHDSVNQALFSLTLHTRAIELAAIGGVLAPTQLVHGLAEVRELSEGALAEMRAMIFQLRPAALREEGLLLAVSKHAAGVAAREGLDIRVVGLPQRLDLDERTEEQLFRVACEALHNIVKHAQARTADITIAVDPGELDAISLTIHDDGVGFDVAAPHPGHLGLQSMSERVSELGGTLSIRSRPGDTTIHASVPRALHHCLDE